MNPEAWARAIKDVLGWSAPMLPVKLGWVLIWAGGLFAGYKFLGLILRRKD